MSLRIIVAFSHPRLPSPVRQVLKIEGKKGIPRAKRNELGVPLSGFALFPRTSRARPFPAFLFQLRRLYSRRVVRES